MNRTLSIAVLMSSLALLPAARVWSADAMHAGHDHRHHATTPVPPANTKVMLPDVPLRDQDGRSLRLPGDVVGDKVVLVSFVFTHCATVCPVVSQVFSQVQAQLGSQLGSQVRLVSLSVDPVRDTPDRLKAYAAQYGAGRGWLWLTGTPPNVTTALKGFGAYTANFENHPAMMLVGDGRTGQWTRIYGFEDATVLVDKIRSYLDARRADATVTAGKG